MSAAQTRPALKSWAIFPYAMMITALALAGCAGVSTPSSKVATATKLEQHIQPARQKTNSARFKQHFDQALSKYNADDRSLSDLQFAGAGFEASWRLSGDYWPALIMLGLVLEEQGLHAQATDRYIQVAEITDEAVHWQAASISALRAGYEVLAYALYLRSKEASGPSTNRLSSYLDGLYEQSGNTGKRGRLINPISIERRSSDAFVCQTNSSADSGSDGSDYEDSESDAEDGDSFMSFDFLVEGEDSAATDMNGSTSAALRDPCANRNILIDAFIIRRASGASSRSGMDLLSGLQLELGALLLDYNAISEAGGDYETTRMRSGSLTIPNITYALSVATDDHSTVSVEASPSILAKIGETSHIFEGTEVFIVSSGQYSGGQFEKKVGVKLTIEPAMITERAATMKVAIDLSSLIGGLAGSQNFQAINTDLLETVIHGTFPYGKAVVVGSLTSLGITGTTGGQTGLRNLPGVGALFGVDRATVENRELLVLLLVRPGSEEFEGIDDEQIELIDRHNLILPEASFRRGGFIHEAPELKEILKQSIEK